MEIDRVISGLKTSARFISSPRVWLGATILAPGGYMTHEALSVPAISEVTPQNDPRFSNDFNSGSEIEILVPEIPSYLDRHLPSLASDIQIPAPITETKVPPSYRLSLQYLYNNTLVPPNHGWELVSKVASIGAIQRKWSEIGTQGIDDDLQTLRTKRLKSIVALETLKTDRTSIALPDGLTGNFETPDVRRLLIEQAVEIAKNRPDIFLIGVEANLLEEFDPKNYQASLTLYREAYKRVKETSPSTKVAASIARTNGYTPISQARFQRHVSEFTPADILAVSVYWPEPVPVTLLDTIISESGSDHPLLISEIADASEGPNKTQLTQAQYIVSFKEAADYATQQGRKIVAINYVSTTDPAKSTCDIVFASTPQFRRWCTFGVVNEKGNPKYSFIELAKWQARISGRP